MPSLTHRTFYGAALVGMMLALGPSLVFAQPSFQSTGQSSASAVLTVSAVSSPQPLASRFSGGFVPSTAGRQLPGVRLSLPPKVDGNRNAAESRQKILDQAVRQFQAREYRGPERTHPWRQVRIKPFPLYQNAQVRSIMRYYLVRRRDVLERSFHRSGRYMEMIRQIFRQEGVPEILGYLAGVESNFNPIAHSKAQALGLWQFRKPTARSFGLRNNRSWYDERRDPVASTYAAARFLRYLYHKYRNWEMVLAAYNAGEPRVNQVRRDARTRKRKIGYWNLWLPVETRLYVPSFLALATILDNPAKYGLNSKDQAPAMEQDSLELQVPLTLDEMAIRVGVSADTMARLNPAWHRWVSSPLRGERVLVNLPPGSSTRFLLSLWEQMSVANPWRSHIVGEGDTVKRLARRYGVKAKAIRRLNDLHPRTLLMVGKHLRIPIPSPDTQRVSMRIANAAPQGGG